MTGMSLSSSPLHSSPQIATRIRSIWQSLETKYRLVLECHCIQDRQLKVAAAENTDELLDAIIAAGPQSPAYQDERLPYWAEVWPAAVALASHVLAGQAATQASRVLEIGCGLGLAGLAAMAKGACVLFTDYQQDALMFVGLNGLINFGRTPAAAVMDWRKPTLRQRFDVVLASDVAYERRSFAPLVEAFGALVEPDGVVLLSEPHRAVAKDFFDALRREGFDLTSADVAVTLRGNAHSIGVHEIRPGRGARRCGPLAEVV